MKAYEMQCESGKAYLIIAPSADVALWKFCQLPVAEMGESFIRKKYESILIVDDKDLNAFSEHKGAFGKNEQ